VSDASYRKLVSHELSSGGGVYRMTFYPERFFGSLGTIRVSYSELGGTASERAKDIRSKEIYRKGIRH
jgi:hypothetical protein